MQITRLPLERHDETLYGIVARIRLSNAAGSDRDACISLFGESSTMRVADFPVNFVHFCARTENAFGSPLSVLDHMTVANFFIKLGSWPWHAGSSNRSVLTAGYGLATLSNGCRNTWRICRNCLRDDLQHNAAGSWRRAHHLPMAFFCLTHHIPLVPCILHNSEFRNRLLLPEQTAAVREGQQIDLVSNQAAAMRLTELACTVLNDTTAPIGSRVVRSALVQRLADLGLLTRTGSVERDKVSKELLHRYGFLAREPSLLRAVSSKGIDTLVRSLTTNTMRSGAHNLLLIDWLFGSWDGFKKFCLWQSTMDGLPLCTDISQSDSEDKVGDRQSSGSSCGISDIHKHRGVCLDFLDNDKAATRSRFARAAPVSLRWMLQFDRAWLDKHLPSIRVGFSQPRLF